MMGLLSEKQVENMINIPITQEGYNACVEELAYLKNVQRPLVIDELVRARSLGCLADNPEFHAAKERQSFLEGKIAALEVKMASLSVMNGDGIDPDIISFGATVSLRDEDTDVIVVYRIVGADEADVRKGSISIDSPVARSLLGQHINAEIDIQTPGGLKCYKVEAIIY